MRGRPSHVSPPFERDGGPSQPEVVLSVCIPTHHGRAAALASALDSVLAQLDGPLSGRVEICISDNASSDDTERLVRERDALHPRTLVYRRNPVDLGATSNIILATTMARGRWIWLLGSDDELEPGAVAAGLDLLARHPSASGASLKRRLYAGDMRAPLGIEEPALYPPDGAGPILHGEALIDGLCLYAMYMSAQIVRTDRWRASLAGIEPATLNRSIFPHTWVLATIWSSGEDWLWDTAARVRCRIEQDAFSGRSDYAALLDRTVSDQARIWKTVLGPRSARLPLTRLHDFILPAADLKRIAGDGPLVRPGSRRASRRRLMMTSARAFWWNRAFWQHSLPALARVAFATPAGNGPTSLGDAKCP